MIDAGLVLILALIYFGALFALAAWGDRRAAQGRSVVGPAIYSLSLAVYCTSWTFYGSVGLAAGSGLGFLPIYLGPTLAFILGWVIIRKMIRICRAQRITSIADFISARHGRSHLLAGLVTIIAVVGIMPYISLQLKAVSASFQVLTGGTDADGALITAIAMLVFALLFGTRHLDSSERHEGMVVAIAFESVIKLAAFIAVGLFVVFGLHDGPAALFEQATADADLARLMSIEETGGYGRWAGLTFLAFLAVLTLPRQFQVAVVENTDETHLIGASWSFPAYLFLINLFVLPIALAGLLAFPDGSVDADTFVLALPLSAGAEALAVLVFIGGLSAATAMVVVATVALSTMVSNDLVMPILLRFRRGPLASTEDAAPVLLTIRRTAIAGIIALGYLYFRLIGDSYALVTIGLVSFAAAAQFAVPMLGGMYWRDGTRLGALSGLTAGFGIWVYTLLLPSFARSGWLPESFVTDGPFGIGLLKPYALLGLEGWDSITHALFWSLTANLLCYLIVSLLRPAPAAEAAQARLFVEAADETDEPLSSRALRGAGVDLGTLQDTAARFIGTQRAEEAFAAEATRYGIAPARHLEADPAMIRFTERLLAGAIGTASARVVMRSQLTVDELGMDEVMRILDETSHVLQHSRELEEANERLRELDGLKDEFLSTVSHEMRTPLTSIRSFVEILHDNPDLDDAQRQEFLSIVAKEAERLTRLIDDVLQLGKLESGRTDWNDAEIQLDEIARDAVQSVSSLFKDAAVSVHISTNENVPPIRADGDKITQVVINLLSNAVKFVEPGTGEVHITLSSRPGEIELCVADNGPGIPEEAQTYIFDRFRQAGDVMTNKPKGSGLGLAICTAILDHYGGHIRVESTPGDGAAFYVCLPTI